MAWQRVRLQEYSREAAGRPRPQRSGRFVPAIGTIVAVADERIRVLGGGQAQRPRQASQPGELIPAISAARQVSVHGTAVGGPDCAKDVDPQLEANLPAPRAGQISKFLTRRQTKAAQAGPDSDQ